MSSGLGAFMTAGVDAKIGEVGAGLDKSNRHLAGIQGLLKRAALVTVPVVGMLQGNGTDTVACVLAGPEGGVEWHVRRITFAPQFGQSVSAQGTLILYKGTGIAMQAQGSGKVVGTGGSGQQSFQLIEITRTTTVPNTVLFSQTQCVIRYPLNLIAVWVAGNGTLVVDGDAEEIPSGGIVGSEA